MLVKIGDVWINPDYIVSMKYVGEDIPEKAYTSVRTVNSVPYSIHNMTPEKIMEEIEKQMTEQLSKYGLMETFIDPVEQ